MKGANLGLSSPFPPGGPPNFPSRVFNHTFFFFSQPFLYSLRVYTGFRTLGTRFFPLPVLIFPLFFKGTLCFPTFCVSPEKNFFFPRVKALSGNRMCSWNLPFLGGPQQIKLFWGVKPPFGEYYLLAYRSPHIFSRG